MILYVKFFVPTSLDDAWQILAEKGVKPLYGEQSPEGPAVLYAHLPHELIDEPLPFDWEEASIPEVDWQQQWQSYAPGYDSGYLTIPIDGYGEVRLLPGPGFGDLSHPSTRLVLKLMPPLVSGRPVVDVGCGSGVLSICSLAMGAQEVFGIDICPDALQHALENKKLNNMDQITFSFPDEVLFVPDNPVILMNMIQSEQTVAWESLSQLHPIQATLITSGILESDKEKYLTQTKSWDWALTEEITEDGWSGFVFEK